MPNAIPNFDFASKAKITRKTLERLGSFSMMQSASSESNPLLDKTLARINGFLKLLDSSILTAEFAYRFATAAMVAYDKENKELAGTTMKDLSTLASKGSDIAQEVATGFKEIDQAIYKIAASTKDNMLVVRISSDPTQTATANHKNLNLKEVGSDLVANLKLFTEFFRAAEEIAEWWASLKNEFVTDSPTLPQLSASQSEPGDDQSALWSDMKENLWEYYNIVSVAQQRFPDLLGPSIAAWQSVASARDISDPKTQSQGEPHLQRPTSKRRKTIGRLLSRIYDSEKRTNTKVKARLDTQGKEKETNGRDLMSPKASDNGPGEGASKSSGSLPVQNKTGKIQALFKGCISAGPIC